MTMKTTAKKKNPTPNEIHEPEVGIFWLYRQTLLKHAVPVSLGVAYGTFINGPMDHYTYWQCVRNRIAAVRDREYDEVPRGRVLYATEDALFYVYASGRTLARDARRQRIVRAFHLEGRAVAFRTDAHYEKSAVCMRPDPEAGMR